MTVEVDMHPTVEQYMSTNQYTQTNVEDIDSPYQIMTQTDVLKKSQVKRWVLKNIPTCELQSWLDGKNMQSTGEKEELVEKNGVPLLPQLQNFSSLKEALSVLHQLITTAVEGVKGDLFSLYILKEGSNDLHLYNPLETEHTCFMCIPVVPDTTLAAYCMLTRKRLRTDDVINEEQYPSGVGKRGLKSQSAIAIPLMLDSVSVIGVIEVCRDFGKKPFTVDDEEVLCRYVKWGEMAIRYAQISKAMSKQNDLNDFFYKVTKSLYEDILRGDKAIEHIMGYARELVEADRYSLFLVDRCKKELYARVFYDGGEKQDSEIRFSIQKGIVGHTATTGKINNIEDAYTDKRFNKEVDRITGYKTRSLLCIPIYNKGCVIGVAQMLNKQQGGAFSKSDEKAFSMFSVFCGLALHTTKLQELLTQVETKLEIDSSMLQYHRLCYNDEAARVTQLPILKPDAFQLSRYDFDCWSCPDNTQPRLFIGMFEDMFGGLCDYHTLARFTLTVKQNYRNIAYHNWEHAFCVANSMYAILKSNSTVQFTYKEKLALLIACICHDLDHRGYTNSFMMLERHPLSVVYSSSIMENHHYAQTLSIIQAEGHNIFASLPPQDEKEVLDLLKQSIIATDLALYFGNRTTLQSLHDDNKLELDSIEHKARVRALMMTCCDLCAVTKAWHVQHSVVELINQEFYNQGDKEKELGFDPLPMMDRTKSETHGVSSQVGFINNVCAPAYKLLSDILPATRPMYNGALSNGIQWQKKANEQKTNEINDRNNDVIDIPKSSPTKEKQRFNRPHSRQIKNNKERLPMGSASIDIIQKTKKSVYPKLTEAYNNKNIITHPMKPPIVDQRSKVLPDYTSTPSNLFRRNLINSEPEKIRKSRTPQGPHKSKDGIIKATLPLQNSQSNSGSVKANTNMYSKYKRFGK